ncbi:hypothetical protein O1V64_02740 [Rouxiella badensis]|nr:hypothetical protein O1V64_02740 [Rouxiella badensis]
MPASIVAALQIGSSPQGKAATLENILSWETEITASGARLVVMPEALLGAIRKARSLAPVWAIACPKAVKILPVTTITPLRSPVRKRRRWQTSQPAPRLAS